MHPETLRTWIRQDEADRGERDDRPTTDMLEENRRLRTENAELRRINEILKAASSAGGERSRASRASRAMGPLLAGMTAHSAAPEGLDAVTRGSGTEGHPCSGEIMVARYCTGVEASTAGRRGHGA